MINFINTRGVNLEGGVGIFRWGEKSGGLLHVRLDEVRQDAGELLVALGDVGEFVVALDRVNERALEMLMARLKPQGCDLHQPRAVLGVHHDLQEYFRCHRVVRVLDDPPEGHLGDACVGVQLRDCG